MTSPFSVVATGQSLIHQDLRGVADSRLDAVIALIRRADLAFTNFEMTVLGSHGGWPLKGSYFGYAEPVVLDCLKSMGFSVLSLANNHAFDLGPPGILSTIEEARRLGFIYAGTGQDLQSAEAPGKGKAAGRAIGLVAMDAGPGPAFMYAADAKGTRPARPGVNELKVERRFDVDEPAFAVLQHLQRQVGTTQLELANYAQPNDPPQTDGTNETDFFGTVFRQGRVTHRRVTVDPKSAIRQLSAIRKATAEGLFVIAYMHHHHWEPDWLRTPGWVQDFARICVDAGARMFVSHGAPVLQGVEIYKNAPIFYGLGNFLFHTSHDDDEWSPRDVWKSVIATCHFDGEGTLEAIDLDPIAVGGPDALDDRTAARLPYPVLAEGWLAGEILDDLADRSNQYGTRLVKGGNCARLTIAG